MVTPETAPAPLLDRVSGARRAGATILALNRGDRELDSLAHETLTVQPGGGTPVSFIVAQHLVSTAAGGRVPQPRRGMRERLAHLLDVISGPSA